MGVAQIGIGCDCQWNVEWCCAVKDMLGVAKKRGVACNRFGIAFPLTDGNCRVIAGEQDRVVVQILMVGQIDVDGAIKMCCIGTSDLSGNAVRLCFGDQTECQQSKCD